MTFGIGRVPKDVDEMDELRAQLEAEELQPTPPPPKGKRMRTCPHCGQQGYEGAYPFSTGYGDGSCDDCG